MDSQNSRSVHYGSGYGKVMVEKNKKTEEKDKKSKTNTGKKATVGAWWKSTVAEDTTGTESAQVSSAPAKTPRKRTAKKAASSTASAKRTTRAKKIASTPTASPTAENANAAQNIGGEQKPKPARKRPPRKKKQTIPTAQPSIAEDQGKDSTGKEKSKPARKRSPRKKPVSASTDSAIAQVDVTAQTTGEETPQPAAKKPARKRPARKSSPREKVEDTAPVDSPDIERDEGPGAETKEIKKRPKKRAPRKRGPRKPRAKEQEKETPSQEMPDSSAVSEGTPPESSEVDITVESGEIAGDSAQSAPVDTEEKRSDSDKGQTPSSEKSKTNRETAKEKKEKELEKKKAKEPKPVIKLLINAEEPEECRLALLEDGRLESIHVATVTRAHTKNNIYKARIVAIEANLQAAFVDYGTEKNGFLPFSEIHPEYYRQDVSEKTQKLIDQHQWKRLSIKDVVEKGQEVLVQVVKEEIGTKGANMTTYLSLPGRCVVLMPGSDSTGISRKISGEERRSQLREYVKSFEIPEGIGWIVRTASIDITKTALSRDVGYLLRLWEDVKKKGQGLEGAGLIYQDHNHVLRFLREHFDPDIQEILVDDKEALEQVQEFVELLPSKQRNVRVKLHRGARPIFNQYSIEDQIESIYQPKVNLPSGGSIVIDPTEALVAIDVNSGSTSRGQNFEESIFQANKEAARELARQLRLRDLGGLIVVDFIDMRANKNIREVERQVKTAMKRDKAKVDISRISKFGLMQISRQKLGAPIEAGNYRVCEHCKGRGMVRSVETLALYYLRRIHTGATRKVVNQIECHFPLDVAQYLLNYKRNELRELEAKYSAEVIIVVEPSFKPADNDIIFHKAEKDDSTKKRS